MDELKRVNPFDWKQEFPIVFNHPPRQLWFVTFVTHNSRISERMVTHGVQTGEPLIFSAEDQVLIAEKIFETCRREQIAIVTANILLNHVHLVVAAEDEPTLEEHIRKIKGAISYIFQRARGWEKGSGQHVWAQKFNRVPITDQAALENIVAYVTDNHIKHVDRWGERLIATWNKGFKPLVRIACVSVEDAYQSRGGFDAVIGNPPYNRIQTLQETSLAQVAHLKTHYRSAGSGNYDIYVVFVEKGLACSTSAGGWVSFCYISSSTPSMVKLCAV
ncbi:MAG: transposase [Anaerolineales bacterium]|nr:transposase [Anaerolineales bacterium]